MSTTTFSFETQPNKQPLALKSPLTEEMFVFFIAPLHYSLKQLYGDFEFRPRKLKLPFTCDIEDQRFLKLSTTTS